MKQVIVIHGGTTFSTYEKYLDYLRTKTIHVDRLTHKSTWKDQLQANLGDEYQVLLPTMPNGTNARYSEWKLWFDRISKVIEDDCILIGHSLGAVFLAKYLSETSFSKKISATILIAAPYHDETIEDLTEFKIEQLSSKLDEQAGRIIFFNGLDDPIIPPSEIDCYRKELPDAEYNIISASDHFVRTDFPELLSAIRST
jgi:predicted alpha/beta hydrolase family esterase